MAEQLVTQTVIAFSGVPESSYGVPTLLSTNYTSMTTRVRERPVVDSEKTDDRGEIGRGNAMYPSEQRSGFRVPTAFEISNIVNAGTFADLARRYMGKPAVAPAVEEAAIAFRHTLYEANPDVEGLQLPSTSFVYMHNEYDYLLTGGCGSTLQIAQAGTADPTFNMGIVCSGNAKRISAITTPVFGSLAVPARDPKMYGTSSQMQYTDDAALTVSLTNPSHKLRGQTFSANNNLDTADTRQGMPQVDDTEPRRGWYRDFLHFGDREVSMEFTMAMDGDYTLKDAEELNTEYTNLAWTMRGDKIPTTASLNRYSVKIVIPKFALRTPRTGEENNKTTKTFAAFPLIHAAHYGVYRMEIVNGRSLSLT